MNMSDIKEWCSLPFENKKRRIRFFILFILSVSLFTVAFGYIWGIFCFIVLAMVLLPFYTRTRYTIKDGKIYIKKPFYTIERELSYYKKVLLDKYGIFLSPFKKSTPLENFRGIFLQVDNEELKLDLYNFLKREIEGDKGRDPE